MDFNQIITAIENDDQRLLDRLFHEAFDILMGYAVGHLGAEHDTAQDCVQQAFEQALTAIREDKLRDKNRLYSYMITCCRNFYLRGVERSKEEASDLQAMLTHEDLQSGANQLFELLDKERQRILEYCLDQLSDNYRAFIGYWFEHPDADANKVADHFDISVNNAWTRKHRVVKMLNECYEQKSVS
jgi:RNA polymerase sigma factor (sigma-70 family)